MRHELSPALQRLIVTPNRISGVSLWNALNAREREAAAWAYLRAEESDRGWLSRVVAEARHFRPATVHRWSDGKIVAAMRSVPLQEPSVAIMLLNTHHLPGQLPMVSAFLDALGVPHEDGVVDDFALIDGDDEDVRAVAKDIAKDHGLRSVAIYLLALRLWNAPAGEKGRLWLQELLEEDTREADPEPEASAGMRLRGDPRGRRRRLPAAPPEPTAEVDADERGPDPDEHEPDAAESGPDPDERGTDATERRTDATERRTDPDEPTRQRSFTTLDRLLVLVAEDTAQGIEGALSEDELDDVVDELVKLNGRRHQSYFHSGFRDVLLDRELADELPAENETRLTWYWTGAIKGWARRKRWDRIVAEYAKTPVVRDLGRGTSAASAAAAPFVVEALRRCDRAAEIAPFVKVRALVQDPRLFATLLDAATELLRKGDAESALPIFELLMNARPALEERGASPPERLVLDAHRRMAHCLRQLHEHARARKLLRQLLKEDPDPRIQAMVHADLGVMAAGFDGLEEVALPRRRDELDATLSRLEEGLPHFQDSIELGTPYSAHGHYCLGLLALGRAVSDQRFEDAERHLQRARVHFSETAGSYPNQLVERASLCFGVAKAQQLSTNKVAHAADVIIKALGSGARIPDYLIDPTVEAIGLADDKADLRRVVDSIIGGGGDRALDELARCEVALDHCPELCRALLERARTKNRPGSARAGDLRSALRGFLKDGDLEAAGEALDTLEELARNRIAVPEFLELLGDQNRYAPAWDLDDATIALARCHEAQGKFVEAVNALRDLFYRLASPERASGLGDAGDLLRRIKRYGIDPEFYSGLTRRYNALAAEEATTVQTGDSGRSAASVRVLVVGGAEQQARTESLVRETLKEDHPHIRARFIRTGWTGNWNRTMVEIERQMARHDALVIVRFMRTHLGRRIRARWSGGPWRSCWSGGPGGIVDAVVRVAQAAADRR